MVCRNVLLLLVTFLGFLSIGSSWFLSPTKSFSKRRLRRFELFETNHNKADYYTYRILNNNQQGELSMEALSLEKFKRRRESVERKILKNQLQRPPNPFLSPTQLVESLLNELRHNKRSSVGVLALLESSTPHWQQILVRSVGAPETAPFDQVALTLQDALGRLNNQFAILVGKEDVNYKMDFPTDPLDYHDGKCWVECRLRSNTSGELLVAMGWSLEQRETDGAWLVAALDWQDFREPYRPGIGREEWERICG